MKQLDRATRAFWRARGRPVDLDGAHRWLAAPMHDTQRVYVDDEGVLRTDHVVRLWSATVLRLHYKLDPF